MKKPSTGVMLTFGGIATSFAGGLYLGASMVRFLVNSRNKEFSSLLTKSIYHVLKTSEEKNLTDEELMDLLTKELDFLTIAGNLRNNRIKKGK